MGSPVPVPADDETFRAVPQHTVTAGYHHSRGETAWSVAVLHRFVESAATPFPHPADGPVVSAPVDGSETALRLGGSVLF